MPYSIFISREGTNTADLKVFRAIELLLGRRRFMYDNFKLFFVTLDNGRQ